MRDTLKIECFIESLVDYMQIKKERDEARTNYIGYSWGWHGQPLEDRLAKAAAEVEDRLLAVVKGEAA